MMRVRLSATLLVVALAIAASSSSASARRSSSPSSPPSSVSRTFFTEDLPSLAAGCANGLPPMLELEELSSSGEDGKKTKGFFCDGDRSGSGPNPHSSDRALLDDYARSLGWGDLNATTRRSCWGTFRAFWRCPEHKGAGACLECKGHHSWLRAPCGSEVAVCDGLMHHFAKFEKESEETGETWKVFFGIGALGKTFSVKSPPEKPVVSPKAEAAAVERKHHHRRYHDDNGDDDGDKKPWSKVRHQWSSEGLSGSAWTAKKRGDDWDNSDNGANNEGGAENGFAVAEEARAAFDAAGLELLPARDTVSSSPSSASPPSSFVRSLASRVASKLATSLGRLHRRAASSLSTDIEVHGTCNGEEPRWRGAPCKGEAKMTWSVSGADGEQRAHGSAVCDGLWSGMSWRTSTEKCLGFSQLRASKGEWTMYKQCNGVEASKKGGGSSSCPWHGEDNRAKGMASWCHGGASGAVVKKEEEEEQREKVGKMTTPQPKMVAN